jgi:NADH-quinone oxidoreductase subunit H
MIPVAENVYLSRPQSGLFLVLFLVMVSNISLGLFAYASTNRWSSLSSDRVFNSFSCFVTPLAFSLLGPLLVAQSASMEAFWTIQGGLPWRWLIFKNPGMLVSFFVAYLSLLVWQGARPFDLASSSDEVFSGLLAELTSVRKSLYNILEKAQVYLSLSFVVAVFLGGGKSPVDLSFFGRGAALLETSIFLSKVILLYVVSVWIRWSIPRLRSDQVVAFSWRFLTPLGLLGFLITVVWSTLVSTHFFGVF